MGLVITREEALMPGHAPESILHRESEIKEINEAIKPLLENRHPENLFIFGDAGTGKTACITHILKGLKSASVKPIYVNCWQHSTRMAIYSIVANAIEEMLPRRGLARDEVYDRIVEMMEKDGTRILLVLDEIDGLFSHGEEKLLYEIEMAGKGKPLFGIIGISSNARLLARKEVKDSARLLGLEFGHYNTAQMAEILAQRAKIGLSPGSWNDKIIEACAQKAVAEKSNARMGLGLLWTAAKMAERAGRAKITLEDVNSAYGRSSFKPDFPIGNGLKARNLCDEERLILEILGNGPKSSTELYRTFLKKAKMTKRQIRNYLRGLEARKLLSVQTLDFGEANPVFNTRLFQLNLGGSA